MGQSGTGQPVAPHCCSSFILLRALPARNHSICVSLKVWFRRMVSWVPLGCLMMQFRGCNGEMGVGWGVDGAPRNTILTGGCWVLSARPGLMSGLALSAGTWIHKSCKCEWVQQDRKQGDCPAPPTQEIPGLSPSFSLLTLPGAKSFRP